MIMPWEETNLLKEKGEVLVASQGSFKRITSGIESLDIEIAGGFPEGTTTMICGAPHTGKSVFSYHFLMESIRMGEPCLFVMTDYGSEELMRAMSSFGWDIGNALKNGLIRLLDMTSTESEEQMEDLQLATSTSGVLQSVCASVSIANPRGLMLKTVDILKPLHSQRERFRVVLDSLTPFFIYNPPMLVAKFLRQFAASMKNMGSVGMVLTYVEGSIDQQSELIIKSSVDNLIHLSEGEFIVEGMVGTPKTKIAYTVTARGLRMGV
jgi:KaiC/GvpD/RAD55 family RecA-like ATPase